MTNSITYEEAGVNINAGDKLVQTIKPLVKNTYTPEVIGHINRWGTPATFTDWQEIVEGLNAFAALRPIEMKSQLNDVFKSPIIIYPNPANNNIHISLLIESNSSIYLNMFSNNKSINPINPITPITIFSHYYCKIHMYFYSLARP